MRIIALLVCLCCLSSGAATYYVDGTNSAASDGNPGTAISPWKTIGHGTATAVAGDTVIIQPATYKEQVTFANSGSAGSPITIEGIRGNDGSWLSIIDGSLTNFTSGWASAPYIGSGVWAQTNISFQPGEVHVGTMRLPFVYSMGDVTTYASQGWTNLSALGLITGTNWLSLATNVTLYTTLSGSPIQSWDAVEGMWGTYSNSNQGTWSLFLRFRDGSSPNGTNISVTGTATVGISMFKSFVTVSNLCIQNATLGMFFSGANSHDNIVVSNSFVGGYENIVLQSGCHNNTIHHNDVTDNYYGYSDIGAYEPASGFSITSSDTKRYNVYTVSKFLMGQSTTRWEGIYVFLAGSTNAFIGNRIHSGPGVGIDLENTSSVYTNTVVAGNSMEALASVGLTIASGNYYTLVYSNKFSDCNSIIRVHDLNEPGDGTNRLAYIYRNTSYLPDGLGNHIFTHSTASGVTNEPSALWFYHNSFSGGGGVISDNGSAKLNGGFPNFRYINNVMSDSFYVNNNSWGTYMWTNAFVIGAFDYNEVAPLKPNLITANPEAAWWGSHNVTNSVAQWANFLGMSFQLPFGSPAIDAAIDTTASFTLSEPQGTNTFSALPQGGDVKVGPAWDMGALEFSGHAIASSLKVINLFLGNPTFH